MSMLKNQYVAISHNGVFLSFYDPESWISENGRWAFLNSFGIDHFKIPMNEYRNSRCVVDGDEIVVNHELDRYKFASNQSYAYLFEYVLTTTSGKLVDPKLILDEFEKKHPRFVYMYKPRSKRWRHRRRGSFRRVQSDYRMLKAYHGVIEDEGEPPLKQNFAKKVRYDDARLKQFERSWKCFRHHQYKE